MLQEYCDTIRRVVVMLREYCDTIRQEVVISMVVWTIVANANAVEVTFDEQEEDEVMSQRFKAHGYGVAGLSKLPTQRPVGHHVVKVLPANDMDTLPTTTRRHVSLPEFYYAVAIDGVLRVNQPLRQVWERLDR